MRLFVDTSVWSLALRRDRPPDLAEVHALVHALQAEELVLTTGIVLQELLQGFGGPRGREMIISRFSALPLLMPDLTDHIEAAALRNVCRRKGVQVGTIDALIAQICIRNDLTLLTTDRDFKRIADHSTLSLWPG